MKASKLLDWEYFWMTETELTAMLQREKLQLVKTVLKPKIAVLILQK